jgi:hypothetical protein
MCGNDAREAGALANARTMDVYAGRMAKVSDEPAPRVEVVQGLFRAVREHDDELLAAIAEPTAAEWDEATDLLAMAKAGDILDRRTEALTLLLPERETPRPWPGSTSCTTTCRRAPGPSMTGATGARPAPPHRRTVTSLMDDSRRCTGTSRQSGEQCRRARCEGLDKCSLH